MDERRIMMLSQPHCRQTLLYAAVLLSMLVAKPLAARHPVPLPHYSAARLLRPDSTLHSVAFADEFLGVAVGDRGTIFRTVDGGRSWELSPSPVDCPLDDVVWIGPRQAIAVGGAYDPITQISRGAVLKSSDGGQTWQRASNPGCPRLYRVEVASRGRLVAQGDWSDVAFASHFESTDGGKTWSADNNFRNQTQAQNIRLHHEQDTDTSSKLVHWRKTAAAPAAIRSVCQRGQSRLCAVGDHGVIMTSDDDGHSWQMRRGEHRHSKILLIAQDAMSVPWALVASETLQWRNRVSILLAPSVKEQNSNAQNRSHALARQIAVQMGASGVDIVDPQAYRQDEWSRWIRVFSPAVIVADQSLPESTRDVIAHAATQAGVARIFQSSFVSKRLPASRRGITLRSGALLPHVGLIVSDLTRDAVHTLNPFANAGRLADDQTIVLRATHRSDATVIDNGQSIATGLRTRGGQLTPDRPSATRHRLQTLQARQRQNALLLKKIGPSSSPDQVASWTELALNQTAADDQMRMAWSLYTELYGTPNAAPVLEVMAKRFSGHSLARWAQWTLKRIGQSAEHTRLAQLMGPVDQVSDSNHRSNVVAVSPFQSAGSSPFDAALGNVLQASASIPIGVGPSGVRRPYASVPAATSSDTVAGKSTREVDLDFELHPAVLTGFAQDGRIAKETANDDLSADLLRVIQSGPPSWSSLIRGGTDHLIVGRRARQVPRLDGVLDDPCWDETEKDSTGPIFTQIRYDDQYVFLSVVCPSDALGDDHQQNASRSRDQSLRQHDHLRIRIDTDQDLWTWYQLEATPSGRTRDSIDGDVHWQPTWYLDCRRDAQGNIPQGSGHVTFEIALKRSDIQALPIQPGDAWYVSVEVLKADQATVRWPLPDADRWQQAVFE